MTYKIKEYNDPTGLLGLGGHEWVAIAGTGTTGTQYCTIYAMADSTVTYTDDITGTTFTAKAIGKGLQVNGKMSDVTVVTGECVLYIGATS